MIAITAEIESGFIAKGNMALFRCSQFPRVWHHSKRRCRWVGVMGSTRNGRRDPKSTSSRRFRKNRLGFAPWLVMVGVEIGGWNQWDSRRMTSVE
ncbi:hypothetical protein TNCV_1594441 [Trichonephila clavipes]|nr:hypothetical protein TNCV_1594441 [Trichonephila clavipes]